MTELAVAKDYVGISQLVLQSKVVQIDAGTEARIIDRRLFTIEVRIMSGPHAGGLGSWTQRRFGRPCVWTMNFNSLLPK